MQLKYLFSTLWMIVTLLAGSVHAAVVDFEGANVRICDPFSPVVSGGFRFTSNDAHCVTNSTESPDVPGSGSKFLIEGGNPLIIRALGGGPFTILSVDLATSQDNVDVPNFLTLTGERADGSLVTARQALIDAFITYRLTDFSDLVLLSISGLELGRGYFGLDNLVLADATVPVPASLPLSALALAALAAVHRRRR